MEVNTKKVLVLGGPTGSGESTITKALIEKYPIFTRLVTATTRAIRGNEVNEEDYYYFTKEEFARQISEGNILEHTYIAPRDVYYGTYKLELIKKLALGKTIIVNPDVVGLRYYRTNYAALSIFIEAPSLLVVRERLVRRDPMISEEEILARLTQAELEIQNERDEYDYHVTNEEGKLEETIVKVEDILRKAGYIA